MIYRIPADLNIQIKGTEDATPQTAVLSASSTVGFTNAFVPKKASANIIGLKFFLTLSATSGSTAGNTTVGSAISEFKIRKGADIYLNVQSFAQLQRVYHMVSGLTWNDTTLTGTASGPATATMESPIIPLNYVLDQPVYIEFQFAGYSTLSDNFTAGSISGYVVFYYGDTNTNDKWIINTLPSVLNANTDIDMFDYFSDKQPIHYFWLDLGSDTNLNYLYFEIGSNKIVDKTYSTALTQFEDYIPIFTHINGFFLTPMPYGILATPSGSNTSAPKLILNLSNAITPVIYAKVQA